MHEPPIELSLYPIVPYDCTEERSVKMMNYVVNIKKILVNIKGVNIKKFVVNIKG